LNIIETFPLRGKFDVNLFRFGFWREVGDLKKVLVKIVVVVVVVSGAYTGLLLSLELASLLECRRGPVHTLGKATAGE